MIRTIAAAAVLLLAHACGSDQESPGTLAGAGGNSDAIQTLYDDTQPYVSNPQVDDIGPEFVGKWLHFWTPRGAYRVPASGGTVEKTGPYDRSRTADITSDGEFVYWPYAQSVIKYSDATGKYQELPMRYSTLSDLRIAAGKQGIYVAYADCRAVLALDKEGNELWEHAIPEYEVRGSGADLAVDDSYVYCASGVAICRVALDGSSHEAIVTGGNSLNAVVPHGGKVYYAEGSFQAGMLPTTIGEWSESGLRVLYQADRTLYVTSLVFDEVRQRLYWDQAGVMWSVDLATLEAKKFTDPLSLNQIRHITQDADYIYWPEGPYIRRKHK
jgi:hypothetical protein